MVEVQVVVDVAVVRGQNLQLIVDVLWVAVVVLELVVVLVVSVVLVVVQAVVVVEVVHPL